MKKFIITMSLFSLSGLPFNGFAQAKLVEKINATNNEVLIPYEKYEMPNGLIVILHEDKSDPIVHVDVTYHVGSAREEIGKSGFAHFFEHMMFQGSDNVPDEAHFKIITEAGGTLNGSTNRDRTNYYQTVPSNQLEKMLWLEADRMGFLLDAVTQKKFEIQRSTVKNERGQRYDNQPYGLMREVAAKNLYAYGHPYSWLTIGYVEDLDRVNVEDLKNFFLRWYGPNNAVLTIGGDIDKKQTLAWVEKYFGSIPKGPEVEAVKLPLPQLEKRRYVTMVDNYAKLPMINIIYPTTQFYTDQEPALDCLAEIIGQGKNSLLYKNLIKSNKAVNVSVYNYASELSGEFTISVIPYPGVKLSEIEEIVNNTFKEFEERKVTDEDISKFKSQVEANTIYGLESVSGKVSALAAYYTYTGNANYLPQYLKNHNKVTKEQVWNAYNQFIQNKNALVVSLVTKDDETNIAKAPNYTVDESSYTDVDYGYDGLKYNKAKDNFNRSIMPSEGSPIIVKAPKIWTDKANGIEFIGTESDELPVVTILINLKGGTMLDPKNKMGLSDLFTTMMNEDTELRSAEDFSTQLEQLGSTIQVYSGTDATNIYVKTLKTNLDKTLTLLEERIFKPSFNQEDFERNKNRSIESLKSALNRPAYVASVVYNQLLYPNSPLGYTSSGTEATLNNISLQDIKDYYTKFMSRNEARVVIVGEIEHKAIVNKLSFLEKLNNQPVPSFDPKQYAATNMAKPKTIYFVDVPNAAQTEFRIGNTIPLLFDATGDYYKATIANYVLGGAFNSRLNLHLREEKGWTYGARSFFSGSKYSGEYGFAAGIKADATDSALADVLKIINTYYKDGIQPDELSFTKNSISLSEARKYETGQQKAGFLSTIQRYNLPHNYTSQQNDILNKMTEKEIKDIVQKYVPLQDNMIILLVGDKAVYAPKLEAIGYHIIELDKEGKEVK